MQYDRVVELLIHGAVLEYDLFDLSLQSPLNQLSILPLNEEEERDL